MYFSVGDADLFTSVESDQVHGVTASYGHVTHQESPTGLYGFYISFDGRAPVVIDEVRNEIRATVPIRNYSTATIKPGMRISNLSATAEGTLLGGQVYLNDSATTEKPYDVGAPSCVVVGE